MRAAPAQHTGNELAVCAAWIEEPISWIWLGVTKQKPDHFIDEVIRCWNVTLHDTPASNDNDNMLSVVGVCVNRIGTVRTKAVAAPDA